MIQKMKMKQSIKDDEFETPTDLYERLCNLYSIKPLLDVAANDSNTKCEYHLKDGLHDEWHFDSWCNPPHTKTLHFIQRAEAQHIKHNINILMIVPANTISTQAWHRYIEDKREYHAIYQRPTFWKNGRRSKFPSRNAYICIVWRKQIV